VPATKPVLAVFLCGGQTPEALHTGPRGRLPAYEFPESAAHALAATARYAAWRRRPTGTVLELPKAAEEAIRAVVERARPRALAAGDVAAILRAAGIPQATAEQVALDDAVAAAERLGYPLVMKAVAPALGSRRAAAAVLLGLRTAADVARALEDLRARIARLEAASLARDRPVLEAQWASAPIPPRPAGPVRSRRCAPARDVRAYRLPPVATSTPSRCRRPAQHARPGTRSPSRRPR
jgi:acyl-CoA synthetase (NDP forming)